MKLRGIPHSAASATRLGRRFRSTRAETSPKSRLSTRRLVRLTPLFASVRLTPLLASLIIAGCAAAGASGGGGDQIIAIGAENEYANVISQIGGRYVHASAIMSNPNTDPHTFEASPSVASRVGAAQLIVQNGLGYDDFMGKLESASPNPRRKVIDVQRLLGLPSSTPDPHLWYSPTTMPVVAKAVAASLSAIQPSHAAYFRANEAGFDRSLTTWVNAINQFRSRYPHTSPCSSVS